MALIYKDKTWRNLQEQVDYLTQYLRDLNIVEEEDIQNLISRINSLNSEVNDLDDKVDLAESNVSNINGKVNNVITYVNQAWEKEFLDVVIQPSQFSEQEKTVTLYNEIFSTDNIITITARPDSGSTIFRNASKIAECELRPLEQTIDGQITLKCTEIPQEDLYLRIQIEIQIDVEEGV